jgi:flagellar FliJ protein
MKKFQFSLETVLSYDQQVLNSLQNEHAEIIARVHRQEQLVEDLWERYRAYNQEYRERSEVGLPILEAMVYQTGLRAMEREIQTETQRLEKLHRREEKKREEVISAKKDTSSIEKLKEKKLSAYRAEAAKSAEAFIDEFVSSARVRAAMQEA